MEDGGKPIIDGLWNDHITPKKYNKDQFTEHILEQYKLYTETTDRISSRRDSTNNAFFTLNVLLFSAISTVILELEIAINNPWTIIFPWLLILAICYYWFRLIRSYRQLNSAKFKVIHEYERKLPTTPYAAEWNALGKGEDPSLYTPATKLETAVPIIFAFLYTLLGSVTLYFLFLK